MSKQANRPSDWIVREALAEQALKREREQRKQREQLYRKARRKFKLKGWTVIEAGEQS
tara:strand:- start:371 stop:544 length:174 start_codon:yes stop_codon:yes gene_type:complete